MSGINSFLIARSHCSTGRVLWSTGQGGLLLLSESERIAGLPLSRKEPLWFKMAANKCAFWWKGWRKLNRNLLIADTDLFLFQRLLPYLKTRITKTVDSYLLKILLGYNKLLYVFLGILSDTPTQTLSFYKLRTKTNNAHYYKTRVLLDASCCANAFRWQQISQGLNTSQSTNTKHKSMATYLSCLAEALLRPMVNLEDLCKSTA